MSRNRRIKPGPVCSARMRALRAGSASATARSAKGRPATSLKDGRVVNGANVVVSPNNIPMGRGATWPRMAKPELLAPSILFKTLRQPWSPIPWASEIDMGRPDERTMDLSKSNSASRSSKSEIISITPPPTACSALAIPTSSSYSACRVGVGSPLTLRWLRVRELVKPSAPARMACSVRRRISTTSAAVAGSRSAPRWPIT